MFIGNRIVKNEKIINELVACSANPSISNDFGMTPVFFASKNIIDKFGWKNIVTIKIS
jgi:hypothetical protein